MSDLITLKRGSGDVPTLQDGELAYRKDEKTLYIGTESGKERLCGATDIGEINTRLEAMNTLIGEIIARLDALAPSE